MFKINYDMSGGRLRQGMRTAAVGKGRGSRRRLKRQAAGTGGGSGSSGGTHAPFPAGGSGLQRYNPLYERAEAPTLAEEYLPTDTATQNKVYRQIIMFDPIAGPATEYWSDLAFSNEILLGGLDDTDVLQEYNDAISASGIASVMPDLLHSYLTFGRFVFHQLMDERRGYWTETIVHDLDHVKITVSPFPSKPPLIDVQPSDEDVQWATSQDPRIIAQRRDIDPVLIKMMAAGKSIPLAPENTMFLPRKAFATDRYGSSYLTRILPYWIYEKALVDATIAGARRRAGPLRHMKVPEDYTSWEMETLLDQAFAAEEDTIGGYILTRTEVDIQELGGGKDTIWKMSDEWDFLSAAKMRALGISETLLSGEASWNSLDTVVSVLLERVRALRAYFTRKIVVEKMLMTLARQNGYVKRTEAHLSHRIRVAKKYYTEDELLIPTVEWDRPIEPIADETYLDLLDRMEEKGLPVTTHMLAQAGGYDLEKALESFQSDIETRKQIYEHRVALVQLAEQYGFDAEGNYTGAAAGGEEGGGLFGGEEEAGGGLFGGEELAPEEEAGGGEEAGPAAPTAPEAPAAPAGGEEGAGASLEGARFRAKGLPSRVVTGEPRSVMDRLEALPIWDQDGAFFGLPKRRYAKLLHDIGQTNPELRARRKLAEQLPRRWREDGLDKLQVQMVGYLAMRLGYVPPQRLQEQTYTLVRQWLGNRMNGEGLTKALTTEIVALNKLSGADQLQKDKQSNRGQWEDGLAAVQRSRGMRFNARGEKLLKKHELLTGKTK